MKKVTKLTSKELKSFKFMLESSNKDDRVLAFNLIYQKNLCAKQLTHLLEDEMNVAYVDFMDLNEAIKIFPSKKDIIKFYVRWHKIHLNRWLNYYYNTNNKQQKLNNVYK